jgi:adenylate/guanylate cyclase family protein
VQNGMVERNAGVPPERRIEFRVGIHLGVVVEESDGDLMGDGVNIAARLESIAKPGAICLSEDAYRQVKSRLDLAVSDLGSTQIRTLPNPFTSTRSKLASQCRQGRSDTLHENGGHLWPRLPPRGSRQQHELGISECHGIILVRFATASRAVTTEAPQQGLQPAGQIPGAPRALYKAPTVTLCLQRKSSTLCEKIWLYRLFRPFCEIQWNADTDSSARRTAIR